MDNYLDGGADDTRLRFGDFKFLSTLCDILENGMEIDKKMFP